MYSNKWKVALLVGIAAFFIAATPALANWSDKVVLPTLADYNIFGLTSDLVEQTGEMLDDTLELEKEVSKAEETMDALEEQDSLLSAQIQTNNAIQKELDKQLAGNIKARELMNAILTRERQTASLTEQVAVAGDQITSQMTKTVQNLGKVAKNTGLIGASTARLNQKMDVLLAELDQSVNNFRFAGRITAAVRYLEDRMGVDLPVPRDSDSEKPKESEQKPVKEVLDILNPKKEEEQKTEDKDGGSGLSDLLPILP